MLLYERAGMWAEAIAVIGRCRALGIRPKTAMFSTGISAAGKAGQMNKAERLFAAVPHRMPSPTRPWWLSMGSTLAAAWSQRAAYLGTWHLPW